MINKNDSFISKIITSKTISKTIVALLQIEKLKRRDFHQYFKEKPKRSLAFKLLNSFCKIRKKEANTISVELIMMACYFDVMHLQIYDCLAIWKAKNTNFDTFAFVDIQLLGFTGVEQALEILKIQYTKIAFKAYEYTLMCKNAFNFYDIDNYYSNEYLR